MKISYCLSTIILLTFVLRIFSLSRVLNLSWKLTEINENIYIDNRNSINYNLILKELIDLRECKKCIGKNVELQDDIDIIPVFTKDDVANWCSENIKKILKSFCLPDSTNSTFFLIGKLKKFYVIESAVFKGNVNIEFIAINENGDTLWSKSINGESVNWGISLKPENYQETLSNSLLDCVCNLVNDIEFIVSIMGNKNIDNQTDLIVFKNGQSGKGTIIDTNNCHVKYFRNGAISNIKKSMVKYVIMNNDSINYEDYKCIKVKKEVVKYSETKELKIKEIIDNLPKGKWKKKNDSISIAFQPYPILGFYIKTSFDSLNNKIIKYLKKKVKTTSVDLNKTYEILTGEKNNFDLLYIPYKIESQTKVREKGEVNSGFFYIRKTVKTTINIKIIDLFHNTVVLDKFISKISSDQFFTKDSKTEELERNIIGSAYEINTALSKFIIGKPSTSHKKHHR